MTLSVDYDASKCVYVYFGDPFLQKKKVKIKRARHAPQNVWWQWCWLTQTLYLDLKTIKIGLYALLEVKLVHLTLHSALTRLSEIVIGQ